jgi:hypothetical protein
MALPPGLATSVEEQIDEGNGLDQHLCNVRHLT